MNAARTDRPKLGYQYYACIPEDGRRHEILDGVHVVNPSPSTYHQTVSRRIQFQLYTQIELKKLGLVFNAPVDVQLSECDIVQPDLVVVYETNRIVTPSKIKGVPDLLIEILSPSTLDLDRVLKRSRYETARIPEYWIVDPFEQELLQLVLTEGRYQPRDHGDVVVLASNPQITVDLKEVW